MGGGRLFSRLQVAARSIDTARSRSFRVCRPLLFAIEPQRFAVCVGKEARSLWGRGPSPTVSAPAKSLFLQTNGAAALQRQARRQFVDAGADHLDSGLHLRGGSGPGSSFLVSFCGAAGQHAGRRRGGERLARRLQGRQAAAAHPGGDRAEQQQQQWQGGGGRHRRDRPQEHHCGGGRGGAKVVLQAQRRGLRGDGDAPRVLPQGQGRPRGRSVRVPLSVRSAVEGQNQVSRRAAAGGWQALQHCCTPRLLARPLLHPTE